MVPDNCTDHVPPIRMEGATLEAGVQGAMC